jgi:hypothetical protein
MQLAEELLAAKNEPSTKGWQYAVASSILGWVLDAFDFFVVVFLFDALAANFHVEKKAVVWTISITLAMRPVVYEKAIRKLFRDVDSVLSHCHCEPLWAERAASIACGHDSHAQCEGATRPPVRRCRE